MTELFDETRKRFSDFVQKDYELKVAYLTNHFQRMWTRFNYFVVIEAALIGGKTVFGDKAIGTPGLCFGAALSLLWYVMGAEDRFLTQVYRQQVIQAGKLLAEALWRVPNEPYHSVGDVSEAAKGIKMSLSVGDWNASVRPGWQR
jgi:hypothetical protein